MTQRLALAAIAALLFSVCLRPWGSGYFALLAVVTWITAIRSERRPWAGASLTGIVWLGLGIPALEGTASRLWWGFPLLVVVLVWGWLVVGWVFVSFRNRFTTTGAILAFPVILTAAEFAASRRWLVGDSAIGLLAYTQADIVLKNLAAWSGTSSVVFGMSLVGVGLLLLMRRRWSGVVLLGLPLVFAATIPTPGTFPSMEPHSARIAVVQGAQPDVNRLIAGYDAGVSSTLLNRYQHLVRAAVSDGAELVVMGETVLPRTSSIFDPTPLIEATVSIAPVTIVGAHERSPDGLFNSAFAWNGTSLEPVYRKRSLVPIIESAYTPGTSSAPVMLQGALVGLGICLDTVHAGLVRESVLQGAELLVFLTDDTFAGFTSTPHVHLRTAALRAAETGRAVVFANESGPSAMFDPHGNVVAYLPHGEPGVVVAELPLAFGTTPFVALGDWLGWLCVVATLVLAGVAALRPRRLERDITSS